jgi:uncharacterized Tic20 family protein
MSESMPPNENVGSNPASPGYAAPGQPDAASGQIPPGGPGVGPGPGVGVGGTGAVSQDDKTIAILTHLSGVIHLILMPLIVWILKKDTSPYLNDQAKEALNFHISLFIYHFAAAVLSIFLCGIPSIGVWIFGVVACILAAVACNKGEYFRYPMCLRLVK